MRKSYYLSFAGTVSAAMLLLLGCSGGLEPVQIPEFNPELAAEGAITAYDTNGDGLLSQKELEGCPSLLTVVKKYDRNKDKSIDKEELMEHFSGWLNSGIGVSTLGCRVSMRGRPLAGAQVELIPEDFFDGVVQAATGTTGRSGRALLGIDTAFLPDDMQTFRGVHQGLYRVKITHPNVDIPSKYNVNTTLGLEVSFETGKNFVSFKL